ncbi:hypothetical protein [Rubellicoccus peritrichatus]|uniref:Beta-barrel porin 2 n=1 Tax=Rubellicoccus peritrichatus TaxID=3080537 RepID=A0AAQ3LEG7_9BACT|nr:hypothetical protein [Puniceicoccus sp. CR14]WOO43207.1 hypothetical protein RZN69_08885 [Puniceicoccus sp. CR14]
MSTQAPSQDALDELLYGDGEPLLGNLDAFDMPSPNEEPITEPEAASSNEVSDEMLNELLEIPLWEFEGSLQAGIGYTDNALLSDFPRENSTFLYAEGEFYAVRYPQSIDQGFLQFLVVAEQSHFTDIEQVQNERLLWAQGSLTQPAGPDRETGMTARYIFTQQVYNSALAANTDGEVNPANPFLFEAHGFGWDGHAQFDLENDTYIRIEPLIERYVFKGTNSDYTEPAVGIKWGRKLDKLGSRFHLAYYFAYRLSDERLQRNSSGTSVSGTRANFQLNEIDFSWRQYWWGNKHFYTRTRAEIRFLRDNGVGYDDYNLYSMTETFTWDFEPWKTEAYASIDYFDYPNQAVSTSDPSLRFLNQMNLGITVTRSFGEAWAAELEYGYEITKSNRDEDAYKANIIQIGVRRIF